jgi:hypothetical protein
VAYNNKESTVRCIVHQNRNLFQLTIDKVVTVYGKTCSFGCCTIALYTFRSRKYLKGGITYCFPGKQNRRNYCVRVTPSSMQVYHVSKLKLPAL